MLRFSELVAPGLFARCLAQLWFPRLSLMPVAHPAMCAQKPDDCKLDPPPGANPISSEAVTLAGLYDKPASHDAVNIAFYQSHSHHRLAHIISGALWQRVAQCRTLVVGV